MFEGKINFVVLGEIMECGYWANGSNAIDGEN